MLGGLTLTLIVQLPRAGMLAAAKVTLPPVPVRLTSWPVQVVVGTPEASMPDGKAALKFDCVSTKGLSFVNVRVRVEVEPVLTESGEKAAATTGRHDAQRERRRTRGGDAAGAGRRRAARGTAPR